MLDVAGVVAVVVASVVAASVVVGVVAVDVLVNGIKLAAAASALVCVASFTGMSAVAVPFVTCPPLARGMPSPEPTDVLAREVAVGGMAAPVVEPKSMGLASCSGSSLNCCMRDDLMCASAPDGALVGRHWGCCGETTLDEGAEAVAGTIATCVSAPPSTSGWGGCAG